MTYYGFNFLWMFSWRDGAPPLPADEKALDFLAATNFNFARIATDYRHWVRDFDYLRRDESVFAVIDGYLAARPATASTPITSSATTCGATPWPRKGSWRFGRASRAATGACRRAPSASTCSTSRRSRARDRDRRPRRRLSADAGEPPRRGVVVRPRRRARAALPGQYWEACQRNRDALRDFYRPWRDVEALGSRVRIGECGCYDKTLNDIALRWLGDLFGVYVELGWGYALWNYVGDFGIVGHRRPGARFEPLHGYDVDRDPLALLLDNRRAQ